MAGYPKILHTEEGMRDGLQIESKDIPIAAKIRLLNALSETGLREINVGSFVSPKYTQIGRASCRERVCQYV